MLSRVVDFCFSFHGMFCSYVMGIGEAEAFSERLKRELQALEAANVHAILESEPLVDEVILYYVFLISWVTVQRMLL